MYALLRRVVLIVLMESATRGMQPTRWRMVSSGAGVACCVSVAMAGERARDVVGGGGRENVGIVISKGKEEGYMRAQSPCDFTTGMPVLGW